ncbi:MAG: hypothetical protein V1678_05520, partial [Candidatus Aenigmatarchaeota archaeon]
LATCTIAKIISPYSIIISGIKRGKSLMISFIREFYKFSDAELSAFDRYRILRNKAVYSAFIVSADTCKEALKFLENFLPKLKREFDREVK